VREPPVSARFFSSVLPVNLAWEGDWLSALTHTHTHTPLQLNLDPAERAARLQELAAAEAAKAEAYARSAARLAELAAGTAAAVDASGGGGGGGGSSYASMVLVGKAVKRFHGLKGSAQPPAVQEVDPEELRRQKCRDKGLPEDTTWEQIADFDNYAARFDVSAGETVENPEGEIESDTAADVVRVYPCVSTTVRVLTDIMRWCCRIHSRTMHLYPKQIQRIRLEPAAARKMRRWIRCPQRLQPAAHTMADRSAGFAGYVCGSFHQDDYERAESSSQCSGYRGPWR
jgi:hypothetical protein